MGPFFRGTAAACFMLSLAGCASGDIFQNKPAVDAKAETPPQLGEGGYRVNAIANNTAFPELFLILSMSGGGKRSSAFSYGVLRGLWDTPITVEERQARLLDEVVGVGSVSGGTFTAAYYGLHRDRIFTHFERDFLKQDIQSYIWGIYFLPWRWTWMVNPAIGTNDVMAKVYDDLMFHGATYADLKKNGSPIVWIGATDISYGRVFTFSQDTFDYLCTDLNSFPLGRAGWTGRLKVTETRRRGAGFWPKPRRTISVSNAPSTFILPTVGSPTILRYVAC
jgi:NTE family protein